MPNHSYSYEISSEWPVLEYEVGGIKVCTLREPHIVELMGDPGGSKKRKVGVDADKVREVVKQFESRTAHIRLRMYDPPTGEYTYHVNWLLGSLCNLANTTEEENKSVTEKAE